MTEYEDELEYDDDEESDDSYDTYRDVDEFWEIEDSGGRVRSGADDNDNQDPYLLPDLGEDVRVLDRDEDELGERVVRLGDVLIAADLYHWHFGKDPADESASHNGLGFLPYADPSLEIYGPDQAYLDDSSYYSYVLIGRTRGALNKTDVKFAQGVLEQSGLEVLQSGPSHRPAANGVQYGWYFRVLGANGDRPSRQIVTEALAVIAPQTRGGRTRRAPSVRRELSVLRTKLKHREAEVLSLRNDLEVLANERAQSNSKYLRYRDEQQGVQDELVERIRSLLEVIRSSRLDAEGVKASVELLKAEHHRLVADVEAKLNLAHEEQRLFLSMVDEETSRQQLKIADLETRIREAEMRAAIAQSELDDVRQELATALVIPAAVSARSGGRSMEPEIFVRALLPGVILLRGSLDVLSKEVLEVEPVLRLLRQIEGDGKCTGQKSVTSLKGWWEAHFSTGQSDDGRIYFARGTSHWHVLISRKGDQKRDIVRLRAIEVD